MAYSTDCPGKARALHLEATLDVAVEHEEALLRPDQDLRHLTLL